jgi:hypothetical protein
VTGPQESSEKINSAHLVEMALRSVGRSEVLAELLLAFQVTCRPYLCGTRGLARWTGMWDHAVREAVGPDGGLSSSKLLWTRTRGASSPVAEEREDMEIRFHSNTRITHRSTSPKFSTSPDLELSKKEKKEGSWWGNAVMSARIGEGAQQALDQGVKTLTLLDSVKGMSWEARTLRALSPALDVWSEVRGPDAPDFALGRRAWHLALLCGLRDVTLSVADVQDLTGLTKRGSQDVLARMTQAIPMLVRKIRQGRSFVYEIAWTQVFDETGEYWDDRVGRTRVLARRTEQDRKVQETSARRGTAAGFLAYRLSSANPKRDEYLAANPLPEDADPVWVALIEEGDELRLGEYLLAKEVEAGPVPPSPEALSAPVEAQPAEAAPMDPAARQDPLSGGLEGSDEEQQRKLSAMRARVVGVSV